MNLSPVDSAVKNLRLVSNNIHRGINYFRIEKSENGEQILKINNLIRRSLLFPFYSTETHLRALEDLITKNTKTASQATQDLFVEPTTDEPTELFLTVQKYNETIQKTKDSKITSYQSLCNRVKLSIVNNNLIPEVSPSTVKSIKTVLPVGNLNEDVPHVAREWRFCRPHQIQRYPGDHIDHSQEAGRIFISTQVERLLSLIGQIVEAIAYLFNFHITRFQKYHYRKNGETDSQIYATQTSPLSLSNHPTSYWHGHATLFLSIPLKSTKGSIASFHVITDPVEGDLHSLLYPRQTTFARSIEDTPAPHVYLLSHNHLDHYSQDSVRKIFAQQPLMVVPKGDGSRYRELAKKLGFQTTNIHELNWWETKVIDFEKNGALFTMRITATPARHWSGQGPCGGHESTFVGYVIEGNEGGAIYFAGDTARLNDDHISKLAERFNIRWNFQPGGPDEVRKDMESTHQASVDGIWMHFKIMLMKSYKPHLTKQNFLEEALKFKTIYMHTMTFKLGNLHLSDTKESVEKIYQALIEQTKGVITNLKSYEKQVYEEIIQFTDKMIFEKNEKFNPTEIASLLRETVIVPKIGSRLDLVSTKTNQQKNIYF